jgi:hypothetical protein
VLIVNRQVKIIRGLLHRVFKSLKALVLFCKLLLELQQLLVFALADVVILVGFLALAECITVAFTVISKVVLHCLNMASW